MENVYKNILKEFQRQEIIDFSNEQRKKLGIWSDIPIANDIFMILDKLGIVLTEYPVKSNGTIGFSAMLLCIPENSKQFSFIGLNTSDYFDKQVFALAHELYHFWKKDCRAHISRSNDIQQDINEAMADRFAAEFLLPENTISSLIINYFKTQNLKEINNLALLRFIARVHCVWWLPYRSIVKRLYEVGSISDSQYNILYGINERDKDCEYYRIGLATDSGNFERLNEQTRRIGAAPKYIDEIIRNFEDGYISESQFISALALFNKKPEDFNFEFDISKDDEVEYLSYFQGESKGEN